MVSTRSNFIVAGHARLKAAELLKVKEVPVDFQDFESEADEYAHLVADNRIAELAEADNNVLAELIKELEEAGVSSELAGFTAEDLKELIKDIGIDEGDEEKDAEPQENKAEELRKKWGVKKGQVWRLDKHWLICGDSSDKKTLDKLMQGKAIKAVVTDPPYGINANKQTLGNGKKNFYRGNDWDKEKPSLQNILTLNVPTIIWGGNYFNLPLNNSWLCWYKKIEGVSFSEFELAWTNLNKNCRLFSHHWSGEEKKHPTMKPLPVMIWCINKVSESEIFDPFCGSGTTIIACENLNLACYAVEIDPAYVAVTIQRWADATGGEPKLI